MFLSRGYLSHDLLDLPLGLTSTARSLYFSLPSFSPISFFCLSSFSLLIAFDTLYFLPSSRKRLTLWLITFIFIPANHTLRSSCNVERLPWWFFSALTERLPNYLSDIGSVYLSDISGDCEEEETEMPSSFLWLVEIIERKMSRYELSYHTSYN